MTYSKIGRKKTKNVPYFSHEYVTANHGDIVSFVAMFIVIGLMFQVTAPISKLFIMLQHNVTVNGTQAVAHGTSRAATLYTAGRRDLLTCLFYSLIAVVIHAVVQDFVIDKLNRRLHLSKLSNAKVNESGQLMLFYLISSLWGANIVYRERLLASIPSLWDGYPHLYMSFWFKFYFICQICYWLHCFPELYFQRVRPAEVPSRLRSYSACLTCVAGAYLLNLNRIAVLLLVLHYTAELLFHCSRLVRLAGRSGAAWCGFTLWGLVFVTVRVLSVALACVTFVLGLEKSSRDRISIREGNFNTKFIRLNCLACVCLLQGYQMWNFINFHVRRARAGPESGSPPARGSPSRMRKAMMDRTASPKKLALSDDDEENQDEMTEADRNYPDLRRRRL